MKFIINILDKLADSATFIYLQVLRQRTKENNDSNLSRLLREIVSEPQAFMSRKLPREFGFSLYKE